MKKLHKRFIIYISKLRQLHGNRSLSHGRATALRGTNHKCVISNIRSGESSAWRLSSLIELMWRPSSGLFLRSSKAGLWSAWLRNALRCLKTGGGSSHASGDWEKVDPAKKLSSVLLRLPVNFCFFCKGRKFIPGGLARWQGCMGTVRIVVEYLKGSWA